MCLSFSMYSQNTNIQDSQFKYEIHLEKYSGLFMCPYLIPKMTDELNKLNASNVNKHEDSLIIDFELDTIYNSTYIKSIFLEKVGIPEWAIKSIEIQ